MGIWSREKGVLPSTNLTLDNTPLGPSPLPPFSTGTPVQNNLRELYALLNFMYPDLFTDPTLFDSAFNLTRNVVDDSKLAQAHYVRAVWGGRGKRPNLSG